MRSGPALPPPGFDELSSDEKLDYVQALWDRVVAQPESVPVPNWQRQVVLERLAAYRQGEGSTRAWTDVHSELRTLLGSVRR